MKTKIILTILLLSAFFKADSQTFNKALKPTLSPDYLYVGADVLQNDVGNYVVLGIRNDTDNENPHSTFITILDNNGNTISNQKHSFSQEGVPTSVFSPLTNYQLLELNNSGSTDGYITAVTDSSNTFHSSLIRFFPNGCVNWSKRLFTNLTENTFSTDVIQNTSGELILTSMLNSSPYKSMLLTKLTTAGTATSTINYRAVVNNLVPTDIIEISMTSNPNAKYAIAGEIQMNSSTAIHPFLMMLDATFAPLGNIRYFSTNGVPTDMRQDGEKIILLGKQNHPASGTDKQFLMKITPFDAATNFVGTVDWQKIYLENNPNLEGNPYKIRITSNQEYLITGFMTGSETFAYAMRLNNAGGLLWAKKYQNFGALTSSSLALNIASDQGLIMTGGLKESTGINLTTWVTKTDINGGFGDGGCAESTDFTIEDVGQEVLQAEFVFEQLLIENVDLDNLCEEFVFLEETCESIMAEGCAAAGLDVTYNDAAGDSCCYYFDLTNNYSGNIVKLDFELITPGVIFDEAQLVPPFNFSCGGPNYNKFCIDYNNGATFPTGTTQNAVRMCLGDVFTNSQSPQEVVVTWYEATAGDTLAVCTDTLIFECQPPHGGHQCWDVTDEQLNCSQENNTIYNYQFTIKNSGNFTVTDLTLYDLTPGFGFIQGSNSYPWISITGFTPILPNTSGTITVQINTGSPIITPAQACFKISLWGQNDEGDNACCNSQDSLCITFYPCCDACDNITLTSHEVQNDTCRHCIDIDNPCQDANFLFFDMDILTAGVSINTAVLGNGYHFLNNTSTNLRIGHFGGIPLGNSPSAVCFSLANILSSSQVPQEIKITWYEKAGNDTIAVCMDTLTYNCAPPIYGEGCYEIINEEVNCDDIDTLLYHYQFEFINTAGFTVTDIKLYALTPGFTFQANGLNYLDISSLSIANSTSSGVLSIPIVSDGSNPLPASVCFKISIKGLDDDGLWNCCNNQSEHCITLESCTGDNHCVDLVSFDFECVDDSTYTMNFTLVNVSSPIVNANFIRFKEIPLGDFSFIPTSLSISPLGGGNSYTGSIDIFGKTSGQTITFEILLEDLTSPDHCCCVQSDTFSMVLPNCYDCVELDDQSIACNDKGSYDFGFTITNTSNPIVNADFIRIKPINTTGVTLVPNSINLSNILYPNNSYTDTIEIVGGTAGDTILLEILLEDLTKPNDCCCLQSDTIMVILPTCQLDPICAGKQSVNLSGFSPNGDGINDTYKIPALANCGKIDIEIYNIWGQLVFSMNDYDNSWDGKGPSGIDLPDGTYYGIIEIVSSGVIKTGYITLLR